MFPGEEIRRCEKRLYDSVSAAFANGLLGYNTRCAADLVDSLFPQKLDAALDIAGPAAAAGLRLAERIGPEGSVTIVDTSRQSLDAAARTAASRGFANVVTRVVDPGNLGFPDSSFDLITCCLAPHLLAETGRRLAEAFRILKSGGRIGLVVWSIPERFPLFSCPMTAALDRGPLPLRLLLTIPITRQRVLRRLLSSFRFSAPGTLENRLGAAGFVSVRRELRAFPVEFQNFDEYWTTLFPTYPDGDRTAAAIRQELRRKLVKPETGRILMFNEAAFVLARKAS
jgi:ubiquinone/menaquinone biosynthesis C-methylase UbiE